MASDGEDDDAPRVGLAECVSCALVLETGIRTCPGCGTVQVIATAKPHEAACTVHSGDVATFTCTRCGRFGCVRCNFDHLGLCLECVERERLRMVARRAWAHRVLLVSLAACAVAAPGAAWLSRHEQFAAVMAFASLVEVWSLVKLVRVPATLSVGGVVAAAVAAIPLLGLLGESGLALAPLAATGTAIWAIVRADRLDRAVWNLRPRVPATEASAPKGQEAAHQVLE